MTVEETTIKGVYVITPLVHQDERGFLMETYRADVFREAGILDTFVQDIYIRTLTKNTVRGLNFQWEPPMAKLLRVTRGSAFLVAVDIRKNSPTLGKWVSVEASEDNKKELYAPAGFARGFQTLSDMAEVEYKFSALYNKAGEGEIAWNDPDIAINWPLKEEPLISERSRKALSFKEWLARPESNLF